MIESAGGTAPGAPGDGTSPPPSDVLAQVWHELEQGLVVLDHDGVYRYVNPVGETLLGRPAAELLGRRWQDLFPHSVGSVFGEAYTRVLRTGTTEVVDAYLPPWGRWFRNVVMPCSVGLAVICSDVTEERMRAVTPFADLGVLQQLLSHADAGVVVKDTDGRLLFANDAAARAVGRTVDDLVGRTSQEVLPPDAAERTRREEARVARTRRPSRTEESGPGPDGAEQHHLVSRFPVFDAGGDLVGTGAVHTDVTERRAAEAELAMSRELYRDMFRETTLGHVLVDRREVAVRECNAAFARMVGLPQEAVLGCDATSLVVDPEGWAAGVAAAEGTGRRTLEVEGELRRGDGTAVPVIATVTALDDTLLSAIVRDLSPLHALQQRLVDAERLEAVGAVAGGIAHDVNNVLAAVSGYADLLEPYLPPSGPPARHLAGIHRAVARAHDFADRLLAFARRQELEPVRFDLADAVTDLADLCRRLLPDDVHLVVRDLPRLTVLADRSQVQQVLLNLVLNARDALPGGGTITVTATTLDVLAESSPTERVVPGRYAALSVHDDGVGMDEQVARRCFEPFFTTRHGRGGHGLGLSTAFGIARQSGGDLRVRSERGVGSTFTLLLPLVAATAGPEDGEGAGAQVDAPGTRGGTAEAVADATAGTEPAVLTVLVVDDDPDVLDVVVDLLRGAGHEVVGARDGEEALLVARALGPSLDAVVSDVHMPGMDGRRLREVLAAELPAVAVLLMSGRGSGPDGLAATSGDPDVLPKPFRPADLLERLREAVRR